MKTVAKRRILSTLLVFALALLCFVNARDTTKTESATREASDNDTSSYIELAGILSGYDAINLLKPEQVSVEKKDVDTVASAPTSGVVSDLVSEKEPEETAEETEVVEDETPSIEETVLDQVIQKYTTTELNIRTGPDTSYDIIKSVGIGSHITLSACESNGWYRVNMLDGTYGYVCGDYLSYESPLICIGTFTISYYCPCALCCGTYTNITASGATPVEGITVAASSSIPFGTRLLIDGHEYIVQDRGGSFIESGQRLDVFMSSHDRCLQQGLHSEEVYIIP